MSRYIDVGKQLVRLHRMGLSCEDVVKQFLLTATAADVVEVVRCRDCKYLDYVDEHEKWCMGRGNPATMVKDDGYCEIGKRKEDFCSNGKARD